MKDLYIGNYKTLMKKIKDTNKWKYILCLWTGKQYCWNDHTIQSYLQIQFNCCQNPNAFFTEINCTIHVEPERIMNSQINPKKEEQSWWHHTSWLQNILQSYSNQNSLVLAENRYIDGWNRIDSPEISPYIQGQLIFNKGTKNTQGGKACP